MPDPQHLNEEQAVLADFRGSVEDAICILEGIGPLCSDIDELIAMLHLSLKNNSQLALVMKNITPRRMKRQ